MMHSLDPHLEAVVSLLEEVRRIVDAVPSGQVITYGEIAALVGGSSPAGGPAGGTARR
nr:MGMT family protein [Microbacterium foliorum]